MNLQLVLLGVGLLIVGFAIGRMTAPKMKSTLVYSPPRPRNSVSQRSGTTDPQIEAVLLAGNKIQAIKMHRKMYGTGLKEAKDAIDALEARRRPR